MSMQRGLVKNTTSIDIEISQTQMHRFRLRMVGQLVAVSAKGPENWLSARASDAVVRNVQGIF